MTFVDDVDLSPFFPFYTMMHYAKPDRLLQKSNTVEQQQRTIQDV